MGPVDGLHGLVREGGRRGEHWGATGGNWGSSGDREGTRQTAMGRWGGEQQGKDPIERRVPVHHRACVACRGCYGYHSNKNSIACAINSTALQPHAHRSGVWGHPV